MIRQLLLSLFIQITLVAARGRGGRGHPADGSLPAGKKWLTLNGGEPLVVAKGGFSGVAPDSSSFAYTLAQQTSLGSTLLYCDIQFTKDSQAFCQSSMNLENTTTIATAFPKLKPTTYKINGKDTPGWWGVDFSAEDLFKNVFLVQSLFTRSPSFDGALPLETVYDVVSLQAAPKLWLNVEYPSFYEGLKISPSLYIIDTVGDLMPQYISSPEVAFLKGLSAQVDKTMTKLLLKIPDLTATEPTTKTPYSKLLSDTNTIKTYASGIVLPRNGIWPVDNAKILQPATTYVSDFHKAGLEVFAFGFANDNIISYNYSFDPIKEYLQFIDNSQFSVDGVITDFPATASEAISCFPQNQNASRIAKALIISHDGASGDYPGSTDLAFQKAIDDGADIIDCTVQMSKDGVAFCLPTIDLTRTTTAAALFMDRSTTIPEIQNQPGIFSFDLTWTEIQTVKPQILSLFVTFLDRNPANKNAGKLLTLADFLDLAKTKAATGVLINIENAAYLAAKQGLDVVGAVTTALSNATFDKQTTQKVLIQSSDSSVLLKFQDVTTYERVLAIDKPTSGTTEQTAQEVKKYANAVKVYRNAIVLDYPSPIFMSTGFSNIVEVMHAQNITVYVGILRNEFQNLLFDFFSDPYVELATFTQKGVDGIVTEFPATASAYMKSPCSNPNADLPFTIMPINPGDMYENLATAKPPEAAPPLPLLQPADIVDPALPPVTKITDSTTPPGSSSNSSSPGAGPKSSSTITASNTILTIAAMVGVLTKLLH